MLRYKFNGLAGCVVQRQLRLTGRLAGVYYAPEAQLDSSDGDWVTICEEHGTICNHKTLTLAMVHLPCADWCEACMAESERVR